MSQPSTRSPFPAVAPLQSIQPIQSAVKLEVNDDGCVAREDGKEIDIGLSSVRLRLQEFMEGTNSKCQTCFSTLEVEMDDGG